MEKTEIFIIRHGETEWSQAGKHTGLTDIELTTNGKKQALSLKAPLSKIDFDAILVSPLIRAQQTCQLALPNASTTSDMGLLEWDYGLYEGMTTPDIAKIDPSWSLFSKGAPEGESLLAIEKRADHLLESVQTLGSKVALFTSGHISRVIMARWIGEKASFGAKLLSSTASISILGYEHEVKVIKKLNDTSHYET